MAEGKSTAQGRSDHISEAAGRLRCPRSDGWREGEALYRGTRSELLAAGLAQAGDFPGDPGGPVASRTYERGGRKFILSINSRAANPMTYWVRVTATNAERSARRRDEEHQEPVSPQRSEREELDARVRAAIKAGEYLPLSRCEHSARCTVWLGTRDELISSGACAAHHFPEGRKRTKLARSDDEPPELRRAGMDFWTTTAFGRDYFQHVVHWDEETRGARTRDGIAQESSERPHDGAFTTPQHFSDFAERWLCAFTRVASSIISGAHEEEIYGHSTLRYDKKVVAHVSGLLEHACQVLQSAMPVQVAKLTRDRAGVTQDPSFQRFLAASIAKPLNPKSRKN